MKKIFALLCSLASLYGAAQNVGIGTASPTQQLDVNGNLRVRGLTNPSGQASMMQVDADGVLKLAKPDTLRANPSPVSAGIAGTGSGVPTDYPSAVAVSGNRACVVNISSNSIQLFDITTNTPVLLGTATTNMGTLLDSRPSDVAISGDKAYVIHSIGSSFLQVFDISGSTPVLLGYDLIPNGFRLIVRGTKAYVTTVDNKFTVFDITTNTPAVLGTANTGSGPGDFALSGNRAYVINRASNTLQMFDISTATPSLMATVSTDAAPYGISITGNQAYVVNRTGKSIQVFDLAGIQPVLVSTTPIAIPNPVTIKLSGSRAYVLGDNNMLNVFDASGRYKPVIIGNTPFVDPTSTGKSLAVTERKAYVGTSDKKLQVFELGFSGSITVQGADGGLVVIPDASIGGDNLGDHSALQNLNLRNFQLVGNDGTSGIQISTSGNVGIGTSAHAPLQFSNTFQNRKIVLAEDLDNDHNFFGLGFNPSVLRYQVGSMAGSHVFYAGTSAPGSQELMRITGEGRVGIGTENPSYRLDVAGTTRVTGDFLQTSFDINGTWFFLTNKSAVPTGWKLVTAPSPSDGIGGALSFYNSVNTPANNIPSLTIQQNGYIGVGIPNPGTLFCNTPNNILSSTGTGLGVGSMAWQLNAQGYTQGLYNQNTAPNANGLLVKLAGSASTNKLLELSVGATPSTTAQTVMVAQGDGKVGIGTASPSQALSVVGNITATGTISSSSDIRFKKDVEPLTHSLSSLLQVQPIYYHWKKETYPNMHFGTERQLGFSAQEIERLFPEIVQTDAQGYKSVDYSRLTPVLVQAVKEQQQLIEKQGEKIDWLVKELTDLKKQIGQAKK